MNIRGIFLYKKSKGGESNAVKNTFITRAKEGGVNPEVVMLWAGHESDSDVKTSKVDKGYTTYSEEYLLGEVHKIDYDL